MFLSLSLALLDMTVHTCHVRSPRNLEHKGDGRLRLPSLDKQNLLRRPSRIYLHLSARLRSPRSFLKPPFTQSSPKQNLARTFACPSLPRGRSPPALVESKLAGCALSYRTASNTSTGTAAPPDCRQEGFSPRLLLNWTAASSHSWSGFGTLII